MPSNRCPTCNHIIKRPFSATQLPKMPSLKSRLSGPGGKLFKAGFVVVAIALWCVPHHGKRPLIVRKILAMEEKQERFFKAVALEKAERAKRAAEKAKKK